MLYTFHAYKYTHTHTHTYTHIHAYRHTYIYIYIYHDVNHECLSKHLNISILTSYNYKDNS